MGGKKKTKWRKLPLEEFTKELPTKTAKVPPEDVDKPDVTTEESDNTPAYYAPTENVQYYSEPYEYIDGLYYPTSCVVYNPADIGMYSNYMMPVDNCYYYYTMPEIPQMQEYVPMPYQEYTPPLPKDTVYLLLPTQTLRPSQAVPNVVPEWQNRRRRRRYEGYSENSILPENPNSTKIEEKEHLKKTGQYVNSSENSSRSKDFKKMTSFSERNNFEDYNSISDRNQGFSRSNDMKTSSMHFENSNVEEGRSYAGKEMDCAPNYQKRKKSLDVCGIHTKNTTEKKEINNSISQSSQSDLEHNSSNTPNHSENKNTELNKASNNKYDTKLCIEDTFCDLSLSSNSKSELFLSPNSNVQQKPMDSAEIQNIKPEEDKPETYSQSLPDILSTLSKIPSNDKMRDTDDVPRSPLTGGIDLDKGKTPKSKSLLSQTSYFPTLLSSEALHNEMEIELKHLKNLHSLQANQSIYKLAYDENVTDQSEADSRSPSPTDPESQVPSSLTSAEILIHEADSGSEAGSEDVELLPHRYESETFLNENKHVYVNKLSLAVELLRTQESLPYDDEFKRVVGENNPANFIVPVHTGGKVNMGFVDESCSLNTFSIPNNIETKGATFSTNSQEGVKECQIKHSAVSNSDSAIFSDIEFDNLDDDALCESAKEVTTQGNRNQDDSEGIRAGYRRFGAQARHYFSPRAALSLNPCFCCIIM